MPNKNKKKSKPRSLFRRKYDYSLGRCAYCLEYIPYSMVTRDHVIPRSRGGSLTIENVVPCCFKCNQRKADQLGYIPKIDYSLFEEHLAQERIHLYNRAQQTLGHSSERAANPSVNM